MRNGPIPVFSLFGAVLSVYSANWRTFLGLGAVGGSLQMIGWLFSAVPAFAAFSGVLSLVSWVVGYAVMAALYEATFATTRGDTIGFTQAVRQAFPRLVYLFGVTIMAGLACGALAITIVGLPVAVWLAVRWSLIGPVSVAEKLYLTHIFRRSMVLVRGRWWRTFGVHILFGIVFVLPLGAATFGLGATLIDWGAFFDLERDAATQSLPFRDVGLVQVLAIVAIGALSIVTMPLYSIFSGLLYEDYARLTDAAAEEARS